MQGLQGRQRRRVWWVYHLQRVTRDRKALREKNPQTVENDRRKCVRLWNTSQSGENRWVFAFHRACFLQRTQD